MRMSYFGEHRQGKRGRRAKGKIPVFGIIEWEGNVKLEIIADVKGGDADVRNNKESGARNYYILYTDQYKAYDMLVMHGDYFKDLLIDKGQEFANSRAYINGIEFF